jgi:NAD-dependent deacetylase
MSEHEQVADWLRDAQTAIAFTGAGISTESGIPDFRSPNGVWATNRQIYFDEFQSSLDGRREYWRQKSIAHVGFRDSEPNEGHRVLAGWEAEDLLTAVLTQNIDGLHQDAGSHNVLEIHGSARKVGCLQCEFIEPADAWVTQYEQTGEPPECPRCGGLLKHATISFGQSLSEHVLQASIELARSADLCLAIGSSLVVEPAASLPRTTKRTGGRLVIINRDETPLDDLADLVIRDEIGRSLTEVARFVAGD